MTAADFNDTLQQTGNKNTYSKEKKHPGTVE
jgi:hypothetical protein